MGVLGDDTDPMVSVMKLEKAPQETYADIGGLDTQIQEIKVTYETCLTLMFNLWDMFNICVIMVFIIYSQWHCHRMNILHLIDMQSGHSATDLSQLFS